MRETVKTRTMVRLTVDTLNFFLKLSDEINKCYPGREQLIVEKTMNFKPKVKLVASVSVSAILERQEECGLVDAPEDWMRKIISDILKRVDKCDIRGEYIPESAEIFLITEVIRCFRCDKELRLIIRAREDRKVTVITSVPKKLFVL